jgi:hypothetical protein
MLMPPIQKDTLKLNCFQAKCHTIDFMAADASTVNLATGHGVDVRVWKGDKCRTPTPPLFSLHVINLYVL